MKKYKLWIRKYKKIINRKWRFKRANICITVEAEKYLKIKRKNISQCITGRNKTAGGFKWLTKERYMANCYKVGGEQVVWI